MLTGLVNLFCGLFKNLKQIVCIGSDDDDPSSPNADTLVWCNDLTRHSCGEFSFAVLQANAVIEDHSQVETGLNATFVGIYDGHGGHDASEYIRDHLFENLIDIAQEQGFISRETLRSAISATEEGFLTVVEGSFASKPLVATIGSCCLVGLIWKGTLYIANLGDSRAVIGSTYGSNRILAKQLTRDDNANSEEVRHELRLLHPHDPDIVYVNNGSWRVKGIIQITKSIGDAYLKRQEFALDARYPKFHLQRPLTQPALSAEPTISSRVLQPSDRFLIFASDGLWEHMTNQEAAEIVHRNPRIGVARKLLKAAKKEAANRMRIKYKDLKRIDKGRRREFHDDITVIVVFLDNELIGKKVYDTPELSIKGFDTSLKESKFRSVQVLM